MTAERNINALAEYFASGCKKDQLLGVELEHFVIDRKTRASLPFENNVELLLCRLQPLFGEPIFSQGRIIGITHAPEAFLGAEISLEPAAQLEISISPSACIREIFDTYNHFAKIISPVLEEHDAELFCAGYHPKSKIDELPLIPKQRYQYMNDYFQKTGTMGKNMMKGTAAAQVSIDYEDEADFSKKFRVACILSPLFSLICDNSKIFEGQPYNGRMLRTHIWNNVDPRRSNTVANALDGDFGFRDYAKYIYEMPPIFMPQGNETVYTGAKTVSEIFANRAMTQSDIDHVLSMAFPDVRLKNLIEIRTADSMPIDETLAFAALIKGLMYDKSNLDKLHNETAHVKNHDVTQAKTQLIQHGANAIIYGKPAKLWLEEILQLARNSTSEKESAFLHPIENRAVAAQPPFADYMHPQAHIHVLESDTIS
ncbi:MAG: glutamate-cysteine ligase family protein [Defluviitaleaceae bacterium]|nr:glutamate-cysteine ligase family protein [Defluviitaleaceae bacterium]